VEKTLNDEIKVILVRIAESEEILERCKQDVRDCCKLPGKNGAGARVAFLEMKNTKSQIARFTGLYRFCSNMLNRVKEQELMSSASVVVHDFVKVNEDVIRECKLNTAMEQFAEIQAGMSEMRYNFKEMQFAESDDEEEDVDTESEMSAWLAHDAARGDVKVADPPPLVVVGNPLTTSAMTVSTLRSLYEPNPNDSGDEDETLLTNVNSMPSPPNTPPEESAGEQPAAEVRALPAEESAAEVRAPAPGEPAPGDAAESAKLMHPVM